MRGTGRYNLAQGAVATLQGIGASTRGLVAGEIVDHFGHSAGFIALGVVASLALTVFASVDARDGSESIRRSTMHQRYSGCWLKLFCVEAERIGSKSAETLLPQRRRASFKFFRCW